MILNKYLTAKKVVNPAIITQNKSDNKINGSLKLIESKSLITSNKNDPAVTGKNIKNEKLAADSLFKRITFPPKIVDPLLDTPGNKPIHWNKPTQNASLYLSSFNVFSPLRFLLINNKIPVIIKNVKTKYRLEKYESIASDKMIPSIAAGIDAITSLTNNEQ